MTREDRRKFGVSADGGSLAVGCGMLGPVAGGAAGVGAAGGSTGASAAGGVGWGGASGVGHPAGMTG